MERGYLELPRSAFHGTKFPSSTSFLVLRSPRQLTQTLLHEGFVVATNGDFRKAILRPRPMDSLGSLP